MTDQLTTNIISGLGDSLKTPQTNTPSIATAAMVVDFNASVWTARKKDRKASDDITSMNYAAKGVANVSKNLLGDCEELRAVQKFAANVRNIHYSMTMPWSDNGSRLLTCRTSSVGSWMCSCRSMSGRSRKPKPSWVTCLTVTSIPRVTVSSPSLVSVSLTCHCQRRGTFVSTSATRLWTRSSHSTRATTSQPSRQR